MNPSSYDFVVVGGGPSGATAAHDLVRQGWRVLLLDRQGRTKPCGGAIPPRLIKDFEIPDHLLGESTQALIFATEKLNSEHAWTWGQDLFLHYGCLILEPDLIRKDPSLIKKEIIKK